MDDLRFAVFGAGFWAPYQLAAWSEVPGARCTAIYNRTAAKAEKLARNFEIPAVYRSAEELLDRERLDFVDIITDMTSHARLVRLAAERRIPVICQKPMAASLEEARETAAVCRARGVPFYIHENWRWQSQIRQFQQVLASGEIGSLFRAQIFLVSGYPVFANEPALKDLERFVLADMGIHLLDVTRFLFGEASQLYCHTHRVQPDIRGEDAATVMLRMRSGATVTCHMGFPGHYLENDVFTQTLILAEGDRGSAEIGRDYWIRVTTKSGTRARRCAPVWRPWMNPQYLASHASIAACNAHLLGALRGEHAAETTAADNLKTMQLTFGAYESAQRGEVIHFPESDPAERVGPIAAVAREDQR